MDKTGLRKAIEVKNLTRIYKKGKENFLAVNNISFNVYWGEIFGLLGPNGAGKTTTIKILSTLLYPTKGEAYVDGISVKEEPQKIREIINLVSGGETAGYGILTVKESLWMFSQFYGISTRIANERIEKYLKMVEMWDSRNTLLNRLSTGMMQKINLVRGLVSDPKVLFLDEPTLGLDVEAARIIRDIVKEWVKEKPERAVILTTHYMAEADEMCNWIAIINKGELVACNTPKGLKDTISSEKFFEINVSLITEEEDRKLKELLSKTAIDYSLKSLIDKNESALSVRLKEERQISNIILTLEELGKEIKSLKKVEPTLEDVFLKLVGKRFEDEEKED